MIPLFKSHFSIGKSILKLESGKEKGSADGIFDIAEQEKMDKVFLIEDSLTGFLESAKKAKESNLQLIFGLRISCCDFYKNEETRDCHKIVIFARNDNGCKLLNKIYSKTFTSTSNSIEMKDLAALWADKDLKLAIPFYDSFIYNNLMSFSNCAPKINFTSPVFFVEENDLPFDNLIKDAVNLFCDKQGFKTEKVKSIYYKNRADFEAFQTYKCICNRGSWSGRQVSLEKPNLNHCGSKEFCIESWKESL